MIQSFGVLFIIMNSDDTDYRGEVTTRQNTIVISNHQEYHDHNHKIVVGYIHSNLPKYQELVHLRQQTRWRDHSHRPITNII